MAAGKRFASDFLRIDAVKPADKLLIQDSADGVVKFAFPAQLSAINGWRVVESIDKLPANPARKDIGYIVGDDIYFWVGADGDTLGGKYQKANIFKGENGVSSFVHIAYSNSADGSADFSITESEGRSFLGIYVDIEAEASTNPTAYKWSKIKGDAGTPAYVHIAYADSADGTEGFSTTDSLNKAYLGIYTDSEVTGSNNPAAYKWMRTKGEDDNGGGAGIATLQMEATYAELVQMATDGQLIKGMRYRMTDYETMTSQGGTTSAGHPFDLILTALDEYSFSERCSAVRSARDLDGYFTEHNIAAWDVWYDIANNQKRFAWAVTKGSSISVDLSSMDAGVITAKYVGTIEWEGETYAKWDFYFALLQMNASFLTTSTTPAVGDTTAFLYAVQGDQAMAESLPAPIVAVQNNPADGKGVIFRMIDESRNDCSYDFKNIMFSRKIDNYGQIALDENGTDRYVYTFSLVNVNEGIIEVKDYSDNCSNNVIAGSSNLPNNVIFAKKQDSLPFFVYGNTFSTQCTDNTINGMAYNNTFSVGSYNNIIHGTAVNNFLGGMCYDNIFRDGAENISLGSSCIKNIFSAKTDSTCTNITLGNNVIECEIEGRSISLGERCSYNKINGIEIYIGSALTRSIIYCDSANIGNGNSYIEINRGFQITVGNNCTNIEMEECKRVSIGEKCRNITLKIGYLEDVIVGNYVQGIKAISATPGDGLNIFRRYNILPMLGSTSSGDKEIPLETNRDYFTFVAQNKLGEIIEYTIDDIINS